MAKTLEQITSEIIGFIVRNFAPRIIDTRVGTVVRDTFVAPEASQFSDAFSEIDTVSKNQSIINPDGISEITMDGLGENVGVSRLAGTPSSGILRLIKYVSPTSPITIVAGTRAATDVTNSSESRVFRTLSMVQLTPTSPPDPETGAEAYVDVAATALVGGAAGNVDASTVVFLLDPVTGIDAVYNPAAFSGGQDSQTNTQMAELIKAKSQGMLGTRSGYKSAVLENFTVDDVDVVGPYDPESVRNQFGGAIDVVILNDQSVQAVETYAYAGPSTVQLIPTFLPLIRVNAIDGVDALDNPITLIGPTDGVGIGGPGSDYDVILDTTGPNAGSYFENSKIVLHPTTNIPKSGSSLNVTYQNNELVRIIQSYFDIDDNRVVGSDVLVKSGIKINCVVEADIRVIPGYTVSTIINNAVAAVEALFNSKMLDDDIQASDIIGKITEVEGIDYVDVSTFKLALASAPTVGLEEVVANKQEYVRASSVTITAI